MGQCTGTLYCTGRFHDLLPGLPAQGLAGFLSIMIIFIFCCCPSKLQGEKYLL